MLPMTNNGALNNGLNNEHNNAHNASRLMALNHGTRGGSHADRRRTDGILICPVSIKPRQFSVHFILLIRYRGRLIGFDLPPRRVARSCAPNSPPRPPNPPPRPTATTRCRVSSALRFIEYFSESNQPPTICFLLVCLRDME